MSIDAADAVIDAEVDNLPGPQGVKGVVTEAATGPCSADEARALIRKARAAADTFQASVAELLARRAHIALGYDTPREMIVREFSGSIRNPRTNKPITDNYLHRIARVALLLWQVAEITGLDMDGLHLSEYALRQVSRAAGGMHDVDVIDAIRQNVQRLPQPPSVDQVNEVVADTLRQLGHRVDDSVDSPAVPQAATAVGDFGDADDEHGSDDPTSLSGPGSVPAEFTTAQFDAGDSDESGPGASRSGSGATKPESSGPDSETPTPQGRDGAVEFTPGTATTAFDTSLPEDFAAQISDLDMTATLQHVRTATDLRRVLRDVGRIYDLLPEIAKVRSQVPHIVDAIEDSELDALRNELRATEAAVNWAEQARAVIGDALGEVQIREDEAL
ncbi:hypothetical protein [Gordonia alkanivorans]|uniref:hypothetical protein n=1 Tax=Gordonia alkanivorans TaxID=84096 RepID=UPI0004B0AE2A|nr:hypothetical protein [Gordonia alkanivorans]